MLTTTNLELDAKVLETLGGLLWVQRPLLMLNVPHTCLEGPVYVSWSHRVLELTLQSFVTLTTLYKITVRTLSRVLMVDFGTSGNATGGVGIMHWSQQSLHGCLWVLNQPDTVDRNTGCRENALISSTCIFDYVNWRLRNCGCMTSWRRESPCTSIEHMLKKTTFWKLPCIFYCPMHPRIIS